MDELKDFDNAVKKLVVVAKSMPSKAATVAVNFTKERFRQQNWLDGSAEPWPKRKSKKRNTRTDRRNVLVKSGRLMRSIRKISSNSDRAIVGTDVEYAQIHNDGGKIQTTQSVGGHPRAAHSRKRKGRTESVKAHNVRAHKRTVNTQMPKRQFLGTSSTLNRRIEEMMNNELSKAISR